MTPILAKMGLAVKPKIASLRVERPAGSRGRVKRLEKAIVDRSRLGCTMLLSALPS